MTRFVYILFLLTVFSCVFDLVSVNAQTSSAYKLDTLQRLDEVMVYGKRVKKEIIPVQSLNGETLKKLSAYSVADALRYFSGVQIKDYGGIGGLKTVNIRSLGSHHVGVFYDGVELGNAQNGVVDLGRFSLDNMEAVSLYNGQKSAIFQPAKDFASANSIYMTTRTPIFKNGKTDNLKVAVKGGSFKTINPSLLWEHEIRGTIKTSLSAEYMYTSGEYKFSYKKKNAYDTTEVRKNGDVEMLRLEGSVNGNLKNGNWKGKVYFYDSERGYPGASVREEPGKFSHEDRQWDKNIFGQASITKKLCENYSLMLNGKYAYDYLHYKSDPRLDVSTMYVDNTYKQQEAYMSLANLFRIKDWWNVSVSMDYQWNKLIADMVAFVYPRRNTLLFAGATSLNFRGFNFQTSVLVTHVNDVTKVKSGNAGNKNKVTPTVVASYKPFENHDFNVRAFYKRVFRMPTLNDLYYTFIGNKNLEPEYTSQYNLGFTYNKNFNKGLLRRLEVQTDAYFNQVDNKIVAMPTSNQFRWTMMNLGYVEIRGIDALMRFGWKLGNVQLASQLNYTYQKAQDFTDKSSQWYGGQIPYIPWHSGSVILNASYKNWEANYSYIYTGERYEAVANIKENYAQPWYTHDFSISRQLYIKDINLRISAEVNNVFNQQYEVVQCYPMPGTNFKIKVDFTI